MKNDRNNFKEARAYKDKKKPYRGKGRDKNFEERGQAPKKSTQEPKGLNDPSWLDYNPQLVTDAANFPYPSIIGLDTSLTTNTVFTQEFENVVHEAKFRAPGLLVCDWIPQYGVAKSITSPINVAAQNIYAFTRKDNSGYANYESSDQMSVFIAMDNISLLIAHLKKIYGMARLYNVTNRYVPYAWFKAMGLEAGEVQKNLATFRARLNTLIARAASISVPGGFKIFKRHEMLSEAVYTDVESFEKCQMYMFNPIGVYKRIDTTGELQLIEIPRAGNTVDSLMDILEDLIESVLRSEDVAIICGDIRKAWGDDIMQFEFLQEDYLVSVIYDVGIRSQIENARNLNGAISATFGTARQQWWNYVPTTTEDLNGYLSSNQRFLVGDDRMASIISYDPIINMHWKNPTPMDTLYATRFNYTIDYVSRLNDTPLVHLKSTGTELIDQFRIYTHPDDDFGESLNSVNLLSADSPDVYSFKTVGYLNSFDWHPAIYYWEPVDVDGDIKVSLQSIFCDLDNYTTIPARNMDLMNTVALMSWFNVPATGTYKG